MSTVNIKLDELVVTGRRLGRHIRHDPRSLRYPFKASTIELVSKRWSTESDPILDQGSIGSCTGNSVVGALICSNNNPLRSSLNEEQLLTLNQDLAVRIYSRATEIDPWEGSYKPTDTGSDGLSVAKSANEFGYISGYTHALSLQDALTALVTGPVIIGVPWYSGLETPDSSGVVTKDGVMRGGHEVCLDEIDVERKVVWFRNSWSNLWGVNGRACMSWDTLGSLLGEWGDCTVLIPNSLPSPQPIPVPEPSVEEALYAETTTWVRRKKHYKPNEDLRGVLIKWRAWYESKING